MASVTLTGLWLHDASDASDYLTISQAALVETYTRPREVRRYAGGRLRVVDRPGPSTALQVTATFLTSETFTSLKEREASTQLLRDQRGRKLWGVITDVEGVEARDVSFLESVTFSFLEVTSTEEV